MKFTRMIAAAFALLALGMLTGAAQAGIAGSAHDFGGMGWSKGEVCLPCHTPHNGAVKDLEGRDIEAPIWNHQLPTNSYDMFVNGAKVKAEVDENSLLCLSCHDGTIALDSFGGTTGNQEIGRKANLGTDLSNDHPIGAAAVYPIGVPYMVDPALRDAQHMMPLRPMSDGKMAVGCTSCHEPHNRKATEHMLWVKNNGAATTVDGRAVNGSALCFNCHKK